MLRRDGLTWMGITLLPVALPVVLLFAGFTEAFGVEANDPVLKLYLALVKVRSGVW